MLYTYRQCIERFGSKYGLQKAVDAGSIYKIEPGIYSDEERPTALAIITTKYPEAVLTMDSAFYYHGLTDTMPDSCHIATPRKARLLKDPRICQSFVDERFFPCGIETMQRWDATFKIYDKERMLIELLGNKNKLPFDYYKEILWRYRNLIYDLDVERIQEYAATFPKHKMISAALEAEVF